MPWQPEIVDVRAANLRASQAELTRQWHIAARHYLFCFESAGRAEDSRAMRFFAARLSRVYAAMGMAAKAAYYRSLS